METKMRIKLYDKDGHLTSDRLVEQRTEFTMGAKSVAPGPFGIEVYLRTKNDVEDLKTYLDQVTGKLPIEEKRAYKKGTNKSVDTMLKDKEPLKDLLNTALAKCKTQEQLYTYLTQFGFTFLTSDILAETDKELFQLDPRHKKYQFLVRLVKLAKDPSNDKYDYRLAFGMKIVGKKIDKVKVYLWGKYKTTKTLPWGNSQDINFKKVVKILQFPDYMSYEERKKWRSEHRKFENNKDKPDYKPSKFYERWKPYIKGL